MKYLIYILLGIIVSFNLSAYAAEYVPATDENQAKKEAKEISGRDDPFNPLVMDDGSDRSSVGAGLGVNGVFIDNKMRFAIIQYRGKTQVVRQGESFLDWKVVMIGKTNVNLVHSNGTQVSLIVGGK